MAVNVHFLKKASQWKTLITPLGAKPKLLDQASPKSLQYPHGASRIWVRLKMMLECKVCFTLGCGQGKPCTPGVISSIAEFSASLLGNTVRRNKAVSPFGAIRFAIAPLSFWKPRQCLSDGRP